MGGAKTRWTLLAVACACLGAAFALGAYAAGAPGGSGDAAGASLPLLAEPLQPRFETVGADAIPRGVVAALTQDQAGFL